MQDVDQAKETGSLQGMRLAQRKWAAAPVRERVRVVARLRKRVAGAARELAETIPTHLPGSLHRTVADTLAAEVLPLLEACRFLEKRASQILRTKKFGRRGRPAWLSGVESEVERSPWGVVLILGAGNYPLLLAGVQALQALVAGNAVLWKPAPGTQTVAHAMRLLLAESGLDPELLTILETGVESATEAIAAGVDHVVLTGSLETGRAVLQQLAESVTPATMELSGCDAVFVLPGADLERVLGALTFGMRFNGSFTCMAPRRVFLVGLGEEQAARFEGMLATQLDWLADVPVPERTEQLVRELIEDALAQGASDLLNGIAESGGNGLLAPTLLVQAAPSMLAMQTSVFAPLLSVMRTANVEEALTANASCAYGLTAAVFGPEDEARSFAARLTVGHVLINDVVIPTADPRASFGGRGQSGFGVTRGGEGLLAMTTPRTVQVSRGDRKRSWAATGAGHVEFFAGLAAMLHGDGLTVRMEGLKRVVRAARKLK